MSVFQFLAPLLRFGGGLLRNLPNVGAAGQALGASVPHLENEATVEVVGQPGSTKDELYLLALATAMGLVGRSDLSGVVFGNRVYLGPPPGFLMIEYDAADNWVRATVKYRTSTITALLEAGGSVRFYRDTAVYSGPDGFVEGANFNFTGLAAPGIPTTAFATGLPKIPFAGREILVTAPSCEDPNPDLALGTGAAIPSPNPKPPGDNRSRGVAFVDPNPGAGFVHARLVPLVFAALSDPGSPALQVFPPPTSGPLGG